MYRTVLYSTVKYSTMDHMLPHEIKDRKTLISKIFLILSPFMPNCPPPPAYKGMVQKQLFIKLHFEIILFLDYPLLTRYQIPMLESLHSARVGFAHFGSSFPANKMQFNSYLAHY